MLCFFQISSSASALAAAFWRLSQRAIAVVNVNVSSELVGTLVLTFDPRD